MGRTHVLERSQLVALPREEVWAFFAEPRNLEAITPDFLRFRILTGGEIAMRPGALIEYRISLHGLPMRWRTRIEDVVPGTSFVDVQVRGPYRAWRHLHRFSDVPGGTRVDDWVEYELPLGPLGDVARALFVGRTLERIFDHRRERVAALLATTPALPSAPDSAPAAPRAPRSIP